jgi:hypothetical protein
LVTKQHQPYHPFLLITERREKKKNIANEENNEDCLQKRRQITKTTYLMILIMISSPLYLSNNTFSMLALFEESLIRAGRPGGQGSIPGGGRQFFL